MKIKVFLADDHRVFRQGLRSFIEEEGDLCVIGEADDGRQTVEAVSRLRPHVVLMDVGMPELNGIEATRQLLRSLPGLKVLGLSMHVDERFVGEMLRAGAVGYLCKKCDADDVIAAIRAVAAGQGYLSAVISKKLVDSYVRHVPAESATAFARLTDREREILQMLVEEKTVKEIASDLGVSSKTVYAHQDHLMEKLDIHTVAGLTKYAVRQGITEL